MAECKEQILKSIPNNSCCIHAFFNVIFATSVKKQNIYLISAPNIILDKLMNLINKFYPKAELNLWDGCLSVLDNTNELAVDFPDLDLKLYDNACDRVTILKTLFLLNGNFYYTTDNNVNSTGYSLEFVLRDKTLTDVALLLLKENGFDLRSIKRNNNFVIYTKNSNVIFDLLVLLGANYSALELQNSLAIREVRNTANRQNNCFGYNLDKTINSSALQMEAISYLFSNDLLDSLPENLKEIALLRLANPDVSLNDLKTLSNKPISRAGIKYRLDKIIEIYKKLTGGEQ